MVTQQNARNRSHRRSVCIGIKYARNTASVHNVRSFVGDDPNLAQAPLHEPMMLARRSEHRFLCKGAGEAGSDSEEA